MKKGSLNNGLLFYGHFVSALRQRVRKVSSTSTKVVLTGGYRPSGWAAKGKRIYGDRPGRRCKRTSLWLAQSGTHRFAPLLFERTCDAALFNTGLKNDLIPLLKSGQTIIMDNAAIHKSRETRERIEAAGCHLLFLPPYSPDFNPIEKTFGVLKRRRSLMPEQTTIDELVCSIL